jgi:hypothetical protein
MKKANRDKGNVNISDSAKKVLKKLIVFDQNKRAGWPDLIHDEFLMQTSSAFTWELPKCTMPFK